MKRNRNRNRGGKGVGTSSGGGGTTTNDNFNRADSATTLGTASGGKVWTAHTGTWGISSNQAYLAVQAGDSVATLDAGTPTIDASIDYNRANGDDMGLVIRVTDDQNYWLALLSSGGSTIDLYNRTAGGYNLIQSTPTASGTSGTLRLTASGDTITMYLGATQLTQVTGQTFNNTATRVGLRQNTANSVTARFDNLVVV